MDFTLYSIDNQSTIKIYNDQELIVTDSITTNLVFVIEGEVSCHSEEGVAIYGQEQFIIFNRYEDFHIEKVSDNNIFLIISISDTLLQQAIAVDNLKFSCNSLDEQNEGSHQHLRNTVHKLFELILLNEPRANFLIYSDVYELLNIIVGNYTIQSQFSNQKDVKNREIVRFIHLHYAENMGLTDIADHFYMEAGYFSKYFKKHFGVNYKDYLLNIRMYFAERDLVTTDHTIVKVATDNGFSNMNSFNRAFQQLHGMSPSAFRIENRKELTKIELEESVDLAELNQRYEKVKQKVDKEDTETHHVLIDTRKGTKQEVIAPIWSYLLNIGCAEDVLSDRLKKQIEYLHDFARFQFGRLWMVFSDGLYIDWTSGQIRNFDKLNEVFDFFEQIGLTPWIVINKYVPGIQRLADNPQYTKKKLETVFRSFLEHMIDRYGIRRIESWTFELLIENMHDEDEINFYDSMFQVAKEVLGTFSTKIRLGGAGFLGVPEKSRLREIASRVHMEEVDFYSFIFYPYLKKIGKEERDFQRITNPDYIRNSIDQMLGLLEDYPKKPCYISEWNMTVSNHNLINDSLFMGTYIVKNICDMLGKVDGTGYWGASDLNYLNVDDTQFLTGGSGLLNKFSMPKPALHAFGFLSQLIDKQIVEIGEDYLICKELDEYHILFFHYQHPNQLYFMKKENKITPQDLDEFFPKDSLIKEFTLQHLDTGQYEIRIFTINEENGSLFHLWKSFEFVQSMRQSDHRYLNSKNSPLLSYYQETASTPRLTVENKLDSNAFCIINVLKKTKND